MTTPSFDDCSRLMLLAPHPDDESLACSVVLQRAVRAGARVRVVYATDGENNPWPQRAVERKWRLTNGDRARWGQLRRKEVHHALLQLGIDRSAAHFLHLPDQRLTDLLLFDCDRTVRIIAECIADSVPTHILLPGLADTHPDHSALSVLIRFAMRELLQPISFTAWDFTVHGRDPEFSRRAIVMHPTPAESKAKLAAIQCHQTQLKFSRRRFLAYASRPERFAKISSPTVDPNMDPISGVCSRSNELILTMPLGANWFGSGETRLLIAGHDLFQRRICVVASVRNSAQQLELFDCRNDNLIAKLPCQINLTSGLRIAIPAGIFSSDHPCYIKLERRRIFFDQAGWIEVAAQPRLVPAQSETSVESSLAFG